MPHGLQASQCGGNRVVARGKSIGLIAAGGLIDPKPHTKSGTN